MAMSLGADDLRKLADQLDEAAQLSFEISDMKIGEHKVKLRRGQVSTEINGKQVREYRVIGVTDGDWGAHRG